MSGICLYRSQRSSASKGFSLVEIVVVLLLLGLMSGIAVPRLTALFDSLQTKSQINVIHNAIRTAPLEAYEQGRQIDLSVYLTNNDLIPNGWKLAFLKPIIIKSNGVCLGGEMTLHIKDRSLQYIISAPFCRIEDV